MATKDNSSTGLYIFWIIIIFIFFGYLVYYAQKKKEANRVANIEYAEKEKAKYEATQLAYEKEIEKTTIKVSFISYKYYDYELILPSAENSSELSKTLDPVKLKCIDIFCSLKNPELGNTITKVAISVFFQAKGYGPNDFSEPNQLSTTEIEVNIPPNTIATLTFTVAQPRDINMVFKLVRLERVMKSDGTVVNYNDYWLY